MRNWIVVAVFVGVFASALAVSAAEPQPSNEYQPRIDKDGWEIHNKFPHADRRVAARGIRSFAELRLPRRSGSVTSA